MPIIQRQSVLSFASKIAGINIFLVANAIVWYASILNVLETNIGLVGDTSWLDSNNQILIWILHFAALIFSAFVGAKISKRINRRKFLLIWMTFNVFSSLTLSGLNFTYPAITASLAILFGGSFGFGMPMCMSYYSDSVTIENRGRVSGLIMVASGIGIFVFAAAPLSSFEIEVTLSIWRLLGLAVFLVFRSSLEVEPKKGVVSFKQVLSQRSFLAYFLPWLLFSFVNFLVPLQPSGVEDTTILLIQTVFIGIFALIGGFLLDSIGRKKVAIAGFVILGLSAAVRSIGSIPPTTSMYFTAVFEGSAWGLLLVLFILTLWGDLSDIMPSDKYYALGATPFFISMLIGYTIEKQLAPNFLDNTTIFSFAAFFLFIAVLPLFYAAETLPEKITQKKQLENYVAKALEKVKKETEKKNKNNSDETEEKTEESKEETHSPQDEEARKLAEKYY